MRKGFDGEKTEWRKRKNRQAGAELVQAQLKLSVKVTDAGTFSPIFKMLFFTHLIIPMSLCMYK